MVMYLKRGRDEKRLLQALCSAKFSIMVHREKHHIPHPQTANRRSLKQQRAPWYNVQSSGARIGATGAKGSRAPSDNSGAASLLQETDPDTPVKMNGNEIVGGDAFYKKLETDIFDCSQCVRKYRRIVSTVPDAGLITIFHTY
jgi:hypothetical protein